MIIIPGTKTTPIIIIPTGHESSGDIPAWLAITIIAVFVLMFAAVALVFLGEELGADYAWALRIRNISDKLFHRVGL